MHKRRKKLSLENDIKKNNNRELGEAGFTGVIPLAVNHLFTLWQARLRIPNFREQNSWLFASVTVLGFELGTNKDKSCKRLGSGLNWGLLD